MDRKISFLFGAGAEMNDRNFCMPSGQDFMRKSYLDKNINQNMTKVLSRLFDASSQDEPILSKKKIDYRADSYASQVTYKSILKKWIIAECQSDTFYKRYENDLFDILSKDDLSDLVKTLFKDSSEKQMYLSAISNKSKTRDEKLVKTFFHLYEEGTAVVPDEMVPGTLFNNRRIENQKALEDSVLNCLIEHEKFKSSLPVGISHILDSHFHTIIDPERHGMVRFFRVFNYYWAIFIVICNQIWDLYHEEKIVPAFDLESFILNIKKSIETIYDPQNLDRFLTVDKSSYYRSIKEIFADNVFGVITSNYFKFAEHIIFPVTECGGDSSKRVAYLNGQLKYFEIPGSLKVIDVTKENLPADELYFPFIFGQSYLKPIVSKYQIEAFSKMEFILNNSELLVILGYNINEDDNHINAYLREFATSRPVIVIFGGQETNDCLNQKKDELRSKFKMDYSENIHPVAVDYSDAPMVIIQKLKDYIKTTFR